MHDSLTDSPSAFNQLNAVIGGDADSIYLVVADLGAGTPLGCLVISAVFLTLDRAGANLENPFARSVHDLPMTAITRTVEIDLKETIDHEDQPSPLRAVLGVLR